LDDCAKAVDATWGTTAVDIGVAGTEQERRAQICEKVFQSALFQRAEGAAAWRFADTNTAELFTARFVVGEVARSTGADCATVAKYPSLLASPGVLKFFAGEKMGQRCLAQVVASACGKNADPAVLSTTLAAGLPLGQPRVQALQDARAQASSLEPKACIGTVLDALDNTLEP
jgi:hypothetical protein